MRAALLVALALSAFLGSCRDAPETYGRPPTTKAFRATHCWFTPPTGVRVQCGYVRVPEAPGSASTVDVAVARFFAGVSDFAPDPVVFLTGGPGQDSANLAAGSFDALATVAPSRDLIAIDQRGTGASIPSLACPELRAAGYAGQPTLALQRCRDRIVASGHDPGAFHTSSIADDVEAVRVALGYDQWNLLAFSYGTRLALTIARDHPAGVRSMVLSSVVPLEADLLWDVAASTQESFERVFTTCSADAPCATAYPALETTLRTTVDTLNASPAVVTAAGKPYSLSGDDLVWLLFQVLYDSSSIRYVPALIASASRGDYVALTRILDELLTFDADFSDGMHLSVQCADEFPFSAYGNPDPAVDPLYARAFASTRYTAQCAVWNVPPSPSIENAPVVTSIPTLTIAGGYDPITPPEYAARVMASLSNATEAFFPNGGHSIGTWDPCGRSIIASFFAAAAIDSTTTSCANTAFPLGWDTSKKAAPFSTSSLDDAAVDEILDGLRRRMR